MRNYEEYLELAQKKHGEKFDPSKLSKKFIKYFENGQRIEVKQPYRDEPNLRGYVGITTGWRPMFILLLKSNSTGSSELLDGRYKIVKEINKFID